MYCYFAQVIIQKLTLAEALRACELDHIITPQLLHDYVKKIKQTIIGVARETEDSSKLGMIIDCDADEDDDAHDDDDDDDESTNESPLTGDDEELWLSAPVDHSATTGVASLPPAPFPPAPAVAKAKKTRMSSKQASIASLESKNVYEEY